MLSWRIQHPSRISGLDGVCVCVVSWPGLCVNCGGIRWNPHDKLRDGSRWIPNKCYILAYIDVCDMPTISATYHHKQTDILTEQSCNLKCIVEFLQIFFKGTFTLRISCCTTSQRASVGFRSGGWAGHRRTFYTHFHVRETSLRSLLLCDTVQYHAGRSP